MIIILSKLLLSILSNEYKTPTIRKLMRSKERDVDDYKQAIYMTLKRAYLKLLYIKRIDLALKECLKNYIRRRNIYNIIPVIRSYFYKRQVV